LMPQFDTFTFLSQETWVFSFFFLVYFSLRYSFLPAIAAILKVRKLHAGDSKSTAGVSSLDSSISAFPEEAVTIPSSNTSVLSFCSFTAIAPELSGVYYLHFSGSPLNVL
jgi:heme/copper-type cytochrome/quinol oxidase subunit 3